MYKKGITVLSLFDGMSCGQIALKKLGIMLGNGWTVNVIAHILSYLNLRHERN